VDVDVDVDVVVDVNVDEYVDDHANDNVDVHVDVHVHGSELAGMAEVQTADGNPVDKALPIAIIPVRSVLSLVAGGRYGPGQSRRCPRREKKTSREFVSRSYVPRSTFQE
jgi:hypothetical protein